MQTGINSSIGHCRLLRGEGSTPNTHTNTSFSRVVGRLHPYVHGFRSSTSVRPWCRLGVNSSPTQHNRLSFGGCAGYHYTSHFFSPSQAKSSAVSVCLTGSGYGNARRSVHISNVTWGCDWIVTFVSTFLVLTIQCQVCSLTSLVVRYCNIISVLCRGADSISEERSSDYSILIDCRRLSLQNEDVDTLHCLQFSNIISQGIIIVLSEQHKCNSMVIRSAVSVLVINSIISSF